MGEKKAENRYHGLVSPTSPRTAGVVGLVFELHSLEVGKSYTFV